MQNSKRKAAQALEACSLAKRGNSQDTTSVEYRIRNMPPHLFAHDHKDSRVVVRNLNTGDVVFGECIQERFRAYQSVQENVWSGLLQIAADKMACAPLIDQRLLESAQAACVILKWRPRLHPVCSTLTCMSFCRPTSQVCEIFLT